MPRTGRRPGTNRTRADIVEAARRQFAAHGYDGATIRAIARDADIDPALVHHYFGTKQQLFAVALELPVNPADVIPGLVTSDPGQAGERLARLLLTSWDATADRSPFIALVRSMVADDDVAAMVRDFVDRMVLQPLVGALGGDDDARLRASLVASQLMGVIVARYVLRVEPLATVDVDTAVRALGPTLQRYLTAPL